MYKYLATNPCRSILPIIINTVVLVVLTLPSSTAALEPKPSFDCKKANTIVERIICSDKALSDLDKELADMYHNTYETTSSAETIVEQQKKWLKFRDLCRNTDCVRRAYIERITELKQELPDVHEPLLISQKDKEALNRLSSSDVCDFAFDKNFHEPRTICLKSTFDGSCLEWGGKVNRDNYREILKSRSISERACKYFNGVYLFGAERTHIQEKTNSASFQDDATENNLFLRNKFNEYSLAPSATSANEHHSKCKEIEKNIKMGNVRYLSPVVVTDDYEEGNTEHFRAYCPNTDYRSERIGTNQLVYNASKSFEFYKLPNKIPGNQNNDHFIVYAEGWSRVREWRGNRELTFAWASGFSNGGVFRVFDKKSCRSKILLNGSARYDYSRNRPTNNRSGLFVLKGKLHSYSYTEYTKSDSSKSAFATADSYNDQFSPDFSCRFRPEGEVKADKELKEQRFQQAYNKSKKYSHPNTIPELCDHNGAKMFSCARDNSMKMQDYYQELIHITAIRKIPKKSERAFIKLHKQKFNDIFKKCMKGVNVNSREGTWVTNVCVYNDLVVESKNMLKFYWQ